MLDKEGRGAQFFVSQICYDLDHTRNLLSDYAYTCRRLGRATAPVVVTLAPCELSLPFGISIESVTNRKVEIEASVELAREVRRLLDA